MRQLVRIQTFSRRFLWAGFLIGFALGGFFDGILLHQILQWHHLLSAIEAVGDLRSQVLWDGVFHALMYVFGGVGLWLLYRARRDFTGVDADRHLVANVLIGFGVWHVLDAVLSHWLTGIHRIRMDVPNPLAWDIGWLVLFGLPPLIVGLWMKQRYPREAPIPERRAEVRHGLALSLAALVLAAGSAATLPPAGTRGAETVTVVLRTGVPAGRFLGALPDEARVLWADRTGGVWVLAAAGAGDRLALYRHGAIFVSGSLMPAGCAAWMRT